MLKSDITFYFTIVYVSGTNNQHIQYTSKLTYKEIIEEVSGVASFITTDEQLQ